MSEAPATRAQVNELRRLGFNPGPTVTEEGATAMISQLRGARTRAGLGQAARIEARERARARCDHLLAGWANRSGGQNGAAA